MIPHHQPPSHFVIPGDWLQRTGSHRYDHRIVMGLRELGLPIELMALDASFPYPTPSALAHADTAVATIPDGALVIADSLAFGAMPAIAHRHADRLRWVALVHHPLWLETGLDATVRQQLKADEAQALTAARRVIVTSPSTVAELVEMGVPRDHVRVVEPGTDAAALARGSQPGQGLKLLCAASVTPRKGYRVLIDALAGLRDRTWQLECLGSLTMDPAEAAAVQSMIDAARLADRVFLRGEADDTALAAGYAAADVFVLPSYHEGFGMVLTEALARGLPIVSTTAGAIPRTVPPDAAILVPPGDTLQLRRALARVMDGTDERYRLAQGAARARARLPDWPSACRRFAAAITGI